MGEKKEKQWAVLKWNSWMNRVSSIVWFDARKDARDYVAKRQKRFRYMFQIKPMTRGPHA